MRQVLGEYHTEKKHRNTGGNITPRNTGEEEVTTV